ncbi:Glycosyltransferase family 10 (fucosyltransferase) C-term [Geoalkalibacter ferrihydriticus]|uniref:Glycosyltransferase n=2 Tax=Geoalkalibacter ferrihydriticus TaxID=392333 RepID=A0A0C2HLA3_9BACT|nr:glycosyltransferase family 10 [Geoalkalibacter ferrihydriticus]KIH75770.1 glycosyltransferase [Geoalkalibacter ferrihydriticus DSM 17813]SDM64279.1 Glycosyltransferase family 10 (fucosyltransferase) C-term [Geoalkalibacter ferrihydriticus]
MQIKFIGTYGDQRWLRQFPGNKPVWGNCEFVLDPAVQNYDWLVVYNDLPAGISDVMLPCPQENTLLITTEPSTIKAYGNAFTHQFGHVLTSQPEWALPHRSRIYAQPALQWFYGMGSERLITYDEMVAHPPSEKTRLIATVCSTKQQTHTLHQKRYQFTQELKKRIPELDIFGHGVRPMADKAESLDPYRYHVAIENFIGLHHWTEKLSDPFLGVTLPFYCGCPNASDYFPEESFIPIDINDVDGASEIIRKAMRDGEYEKRLPHILEARRRVLEEYNIFAVLSRLIEERETDMTSTSSGGVILSRRELRKRHPLVSVQHFYEKCRLRILHALKDTQGG